MYQTPSHRAVSFFVPGGYHAWHPPGGHLMNSIVAAILTLLIALVFLRLMDFLAGRGWIEPRLSRKLIHIGTGPIFVLCWLMFPPAPESRWLAALVPLMIVAQFALVGLG